MTRQPERWRLAALAAVATLALVACGGDDDANGGNDVTSSVPASASASVDGFIEYLKRLVVSMADALEPVDVSAVTPPLDETGEPRSLD